jgi:hypothetical protein
VPKRLLHVEPQVEISKTAVAKKKKPAGMNDLRGKKEYIAA